MSNIPKKCPASRLWVSRVNAWPNILRIAFYYLNTNLVNDRSTAWKRQAPTTPWPQTLTTFVKLLISPFMTAGKKHDSQCRASTAEF